MLFFLMNTVLSSVTFLIVCTKTGSVRSAKWMEIWYSLVVNVQKDACFGINAVYMHAMNWLKIRLKKDFSRKMHPPPPPKKKKINK